jgi:hypothetical protein
MVPNTIAIAHNIAQKNDFVCGPRICKSRLKRGEISVSIGKPKASHPFLTYPA